MNHPDPCERRAYAQVPVRWSYRLPNGGAEAARTHGAAGRPVVNQMRAAEAARTDTTPTASGGAREATEVVRSEYSIDLSCGKLVLMDQPSESVASTDVTRLRLPGCH